MRRISTPVCCSSSVMTGPQRVAVERVSVQRLGVQHELAALGLGRRGGDRYFAAELVWRPRFPFADALDLRSVQRINFGAALPVILEAYPMCQSEEVGEAHLECLVAVDLAADVADHPAEADAQELHGASRPLELVGMAVAADHDRGALGHPPIALPQRHTAALCKIDQFFQCAMAEPRIGRVRDRPRPSPGQAPAAPSCRPPPVRDPWSPARRSCALPTGSPGARRPVVPRPTAAANASATSGRTAAGDRSSVHRRRTGNTGSPASARTAPRPTGRACASKSTAPLPVASASQADRLPARRRWQSGCRETPNRSPAPATPTDGRDR